MTYSLITLALNADDRCCCIRIGLWIPIAQVHPTFSAYLLDTEQWRHLRNRNPQTNPNTATTVVGIQGKCDQRISHLASDWSNSGQDSILEPQISIKETTVTKVKQV